MVSSKNDSLRDVPRYVCLQHGRAGQLVATKAFIYNYPHESRSGTAFVCGIVMLCL